MNKNKLDKLKGIFHRDQKEKLITEDGKRNLYFDRERKNFIKFTLEVTTTCSTIFKTYKEEINKKLIEIIGVNIDLNNYAFFIVELIANKYDYKPILIDLKIGMNDNILFNTLQNKQLMLCYLPINKPNFLIKKNSRNLPQILPEQNDLYKGIEINNYKHKDESKREVYLPKTIIHYYNDEKNCFSKEKIKVTEKELVIYANKNRSILIKDMREMKVMPGGNEKEIQAFFKDYIINGEKPKYCVEIITADKEKLLIGRNTFEHFTTLVRSIELASNNFANYFANTTLNNKILEESNGLFATNNFLAQRCFSINDIVINKEKRKILFKNFEEINLANIVNNIMEYKSFFKKQKYYKAVGKIKNILEIIKEKMTKEELDKYEKIISKERIEKIEEINNKIKEIYGENNDDILIDRDEKKSNELKKIINIYTFDPLYLEIKEEYISKYFNENYSSNENNNNTQIMENFKLISGYYFSKIFKINKEKDILFLGGEEVEENIKKENDKIIQKRFSKVKDALKI